MCKVVRCIESLKKGVCGGRVVIVVEAIERCEMFFEKKKHQCLG